MKGRSDGPFATKNDTVTSMEDQMHISDTDVGSVMAMTPRTILAMMAKVPSPNKKMRAIFLLRLIRRWWSVERGIIITTRR
jgi:hypothetical protein